MLIGQKIAKNRKLLKEQFERITKGKDTVVSYEQGRQVIGDFLKQHFSGISDEKIRCLLRPAEQQGANVDGLGNNYDYARLLDVYKKRHAGPQI